MIESIAILVLWNVGTEEPGFVVLDLDVRLRNRRLAFPETLDLGTCQNHARFEGITDSVVVRRAAVSCDHLDFPIVAQDLPSMGLISTGALCL